MSLGKLPGFKGLVSGSQAKRRFKSDLSVDMISSPLGDFRHTMHVGRGGDVFGDTSFLSNYGGVREPGSPDSNSSKTGFFTRTFRHVRKDSAPRPRGGSRDLSSPPPDVSPIIKNAISLPQLNTDSTNGFLERAMFPSSLSSADDALCAYGLQSGFLTLPRPSRLDRQGPDRESCRGSLPRSDSLTSFTLDLGPSLMTEVLSLIDSRTCLQTAYHSQAGGEEGEEEEEDDISLTETPVQSPDVMSPNPSMSVYSRHMNNRGRCCDTDCTQPEEQRSLKSPDESGIEAEHFQRAADVLSRHYGGASFTNRKRVSSSTSPVSKHSSTPAEDEEIKV